MLDGIRKNYGATLDPYELKTGTVWICLLSWLSVSLLILSLERSWNIVLYTLSFGAGYGGLVYISRAWLRKRLEQMGRFRFPVFLAVAVVVSVLEELYVYALGNSIAVPDVWLDIIIVPSEWAAWFTTWYFVISRRFYFSEKQALLCAGLSGILFEYSGKGFLVSDPLAMLIFFPTTVVVYSAIFVLPMQFINFRGTWRSWARFPAAVFLPFLASIPVGLILYFTLLS